MTNKEATNYLQKVYESTKNSSYASALAIALSVMQAQQEAEKNEPLTLDEIRNSRREPLYFCALTSDWPYEGWYVVESKTNDCISIAYVQGEIDKWIVLDCYGERWLAYRRPPKGGNHEI